MIQVRDGSRILQFDGRQIGHSSSWRRGSYRWVEFNLYKTSGGMYVLSRIGQSMLYHRPDCEVVERNSLKPAPRADLSEDAYPCHICSSERYTGEIICPERPRFWAQQADSPQAVLDALYKKDESGSHYLTLVAQRLLNDASENDDEISMAYRVETIR